MKKTFPRRPPLIPLGLCAALLSLLACPALARIGETTEEIAARYGTSTEDVTHKQSDFYGSASPILLYAKGGLIVRVAFFDGKSAAEAYWHADGSEMTAAEMDTLRDNNKGPSKWVGVFTTGLNIAYMRDDDFLSSDYSHTTHIFQISRSDLMTGKIKNSPKPLTGF